VLEDMMWWTFGWTAGVLSLMQVQVIRAHRFRNANKVGTSRWEQQ